MCHTLTPLNIVVCPYPKITLFVGRESILERIRKEFQHTSCIGVLQGSRTVALYGLKGAGYEISLLILLASVSAKIYLGNLRSPLNMSIGDIKPAQISSYFGSRQLPVTNFFKATLISRKVVGYLGGKTSY